MACADGRTTYLGGDAAVNGRRHGGSLLRLLTRALGEGQGLGLLRRKAGGPALGSDDGRYIGQVTLDLAFAAGAHQVAEEKIATPCGSESKVDKRHGEVRGW